MVLKSRGGKKFSRASRAILPPLDKFLATPLLGKVGIALTAYYLNSPEIQSLEILKTGSTKISYNILIHKTF